MSKRVLEMLDAAGGRWRRLDYDELLRECEKDAEYSILVRARTLKRKRSKVRR